MGVERKGDAGRELRDGERDNGEERDWNDDGVGSCSRNRERQRKLGEIVVIWFVGYCC